MRRALAALLLGAAAIAAAPAKDVVRVEVLLIRHGVRSPTKPGSAYSAYAVGTWPTWPVAPGMLTAHGHDGMRGIGARLRTAFVEEGTLSATCPTAATLTVIGDSTPRNLDSSAALVDGLAPSCGSGFLAARGDATNPLFHYRKDDDDDAPADAGLPHPALDALQSLLLACNGHDDCASVAQREGKHLLPDSPSAAMKLAGTLSENLMLAYAEGMPMSSVAFGRGDVSLLGRLIALHDAQFGATKKAMPAAAQAASNLAAHIVATLDAAAGATPSVAPLVTSPHGVVLLVGHDTNLANIAGVFGLDWHDDKRPDDYPPGGAVAFALIHRGNHDVVRVRAFMPSMDQLRTNRFDAVRAIPVHIAGCRVIGECTIDEFRAVARKGIDASRVDAALPAMDLRHAP